MLPSTRYTHGYDIEAEGLSTSPLEKKKKSSAVRFPAGDWGFLQEDELNSLEDGILTPGGDPRSRVVSAPMQIQDREWYTAPNTEVRSNSSESAHLSDTLRLQRSSSRRQRGTRGDIPAGGAGHSRTVSTSEFRARRVAGDESQRLLPPLPSYGHEQRNQTPRPDARDTYRPRRDTQLHTFNEILDFAIDNDVDVADIVADHRVDTRALVETVLERVVEQRMRRLEEARQLQIQPGNRLQEPDASTQQVPHSPFFFLALANVIIIQQLLTLLTRLQNDLPSPPHPPTSPHQQPTTAPTAIDDNAIAMLPGVGRDGSGAWKCNCFFYDGTRRELCGARFAHTRAFLEHRRVVHRLGGAGAVVIIESRRCVFVCVFLSVGANVFWGVQGAGGRVWEVWGRVWKGGAGAAA